MTTVMYFSLFIILPYICFLFSLLGLLRKIFNFFTSPNQFTPEARSTSQKNVLYLILLHFIGYTVIKGFFTLFGVHGKRLNNLTILIEGMVIAIFLTILTYKFFNTKIKQSVLCYKSVANKLMLVLIIIHIFAGYVGIMFIQDGFSKQTVSTMLAKYYKDLFSFNTNAYVYLLHVNYITLTHLLLGFLFLALLPYTKIIEDIITMPWILFNYFLKTR